ncbi:MAG: hypothetical protein WCI43_00500 [Candidatus Firestonebacteria bacterium]
MIKYLSLFIALSVVLALPAAAKENVNESKTLIASESKIELKDNTTGKTTVLYDGTEEDFIKSVTADAAFSKVFFIKRGRLFLLNTADKEIKQYSLGPQDKIMYYISAGIASGGNTIFGIYASLDGGAPNPLWVGELKKYAEDEEYEGQMVRSGDSFKEACWRKNSRIIEAELYSEQKVLIDADKLKIAPFQQEKK